MGTTFLVIFTLLFLFFQTYGASSSNTMITTSSNISCIQRERQSLLVFKQSVGDGSNRLATWTGVECCEWQGVGCDRRNGHIVKLDLRSPSSDYYISDTGNWLTGKVSPSLLQLKHLRYLDLSMNNFSGNIPEFFGSFKYLEYLNLSRSGFSGVIPPHLGNLSRLQYLDLNLLDSYHMMSPRDEGSLMVKDDLMWVSLLLSLKHLDFSGITIGNHTDWFHPVNMLPSLLTLNLARCDINIPSIKFINFTSLNSLDLSSNGINSTIPVWLSNLTDLMHLNLENNNFHGRIPDSVGTLCSLSSIDISSNRLDTSMPDLFWNLSSLVLLDLSNNKFYGLIPDSIGTLSSLSSMDLSMNQLSGPIPPSLGGLSSLTELTLWYNQLCGPIPPSLGGLSSLKKLDLSFNQLSGSIPESIGLLTRLTTLSLRNNQLNGSIPESIGLLTRLKALRLTSNQLNGNIPTSLGELSDLQHLELNRNQLSGVVSEIHFTKLNNLVDLWLSNNSLTLNVSPHWIPPFQLLNSFRASSCNIGPRFPNWLQTLTDLQYLYLKNSSIIDTIPEWFENIFSRMVNLDFSDNQISGDMARVITNKTGLNLVNLGKNGFSGSIPTHLCELLSIEILDLSDNNFSGVLPKCLGNLLDLLVMDLKNNTITGDVPNSLGSLSKLQSLHLHDNKFKGNIPVTLQKLTNLVTFDLGNNLLTGNIPSWIGKRLSKLRILNLQSNKFMGKIPLELCQIKDLQHLNLANNNITGNIPHCNLTGMIMSDFNFPNDFNMPNADDDYEEHIEAYIKGIQLKYTKTLRFLISIDLSSNKINGEIPDVLMNLASLKNLNLSRNLLSGHIPKRIGNLKSMESLDLSKNKLSGRIPPSLANLNYLSYLNLSSNNLFGPIPVGNQFNTFDDPTMYEGNNGLCGFPLRSCKGNNSVYTHVDDESKDSSQGLSWFYTGMVSGSVVGCMGFIGNLYFIRNWRVTYFEMIENVYSWLIVSILVTLARLKRKHFK